MFSLIISGCIDKKEDRIATSDVRQKPRDAIEKPTEITILNTENNELIDTLRKKFIPESIMVQIDTKHKLDALSKLLFFTGKQFPENETNVFVCKNFSCSLPLTNMEEIEENI